MTLSDEEFGGAAVNAPGESGKSIAASRRPHLEFGDQGRRDVFKPRGKRKKVTNEKRKKRRRIVSLVAGRKKNTSFTIFKISDIEYLRIKKAPVWREDAGLHLAAPPDLRL